MTTQTVTGLLVTSGGNIPLSSTLTDGTEGEVKTDTTYTVTAQSIGTYAEGQTVQGAYIQAATGISYAYILRNGRVLSVVQSLGSLAIGGGKGVEAMNPVTLQAGDILRVLVHA